MTVQTIDLKKGLPVENGGHILYVFKNKSLYVDNLVAYVVDGIKLGHRVLIIDQADVYQELRARLLNQFSEEEIQHVFFEDNGTFYGIHTEFSCEKIVTHFEEIMQSIPEPNRMIRTWAQVVWRDEQDIISKLEKYEKNADNVLYRQGILSVCAYDGTGIPADQLVSSLKNHEYFMTDAELVRSPLYIQPNHPGVFPSLSVHAKIESEMDFYKKKLDFVHVVSHEVRNPLTIINAYANILRTSEPHLSTQGLERLVAIEQYVSVIDHEITHIIETERMLSNELYMKLELIYPCNTVEAVVTLMKVKSAVQNVKFICQMDLSPTHAMIGNEMGLRLILSNLLSNAIKYSGEQGHVEFSVLVDENQIRFVIKDNGVGMTNDQLNSLYQKYGKLDESKTGQGIGLYIVKKLIDRFKGKIHFVSEQGDGTQVTVSVPLFNQEIDASSVVR